MWIEENIIPENLSSLSNNQLIDKLKLVRKKYEFFYSRELRRLDKIKGEAIIRDLDQFEELQKQYNTLKCTTPEYWFENWDVHHTLLAEAEKRKLSIPIEQERSVNLLCFG
jgi:hypothetical protein